MDKSLQTRQPQSYVNVEELYAWLPKHNNRTAVSLVAYNCENIYKLYVHIKIN